MNPKFLVESLETQSSHAYWEPASVGNAPLVEGSALPDKLALNQACEEVHTEEDHQLEQAPPSRPP